MQLGNQVRFTDKIDEKQRLFKIDTIEAFILCVSTLAYRVRNKKRTHVQFLSADKFKLAEIRAAYWCWINEHECGATPEDLHREYKASYLIPILCRVNEEFAELVYRETVNGTTSKSLLRLISISDGSGITSKIMQEFFTACQHHKDHYESIL